MLNSKSYRWRPQEIGMVSVPPDDYGFNDAGRTERMQVLGEINSLIGQIEMSAGITSSHEDVLVALHDRFAVAVGEADKTRLEKYQKIKNVFGMNARWLEIYNNKRGKHNDKKNIPSD